MCYRGTVDKRYVQSNTWSVHSCRTIQTYTRKTLSHDLNSPVWISDLFQLCPMNPPYNDMSYCKKYIVYSGTYRILPLTAVYALCFKGLFQGYVGVFLHRSWSQMVPKLQVPDFQEPQGAKLSNQLMADFLLL